MRWTIEHGMPRVLPALLLSWLVLARGGQAAPANPGDPFAPDRVLDVRLQLAPADWDLLRHQHPDLLASLGPQRLEKNPPKPYATFKASVTIDGVAFPAVGVHKRGFLGSSSSERPSLGLRFDTFKEGLSFAGQTKMSLNNNLQDLSLVHQAIAYRVFNAAGVPAPRCNFARVTVNGKYLGVYSHVEAVDALFLQRHFGDGRGNLYEGQLSDFRPGWVKTFEKKTNKSAAGRADLEAVVRALESDDAQLLARLEGVVDVEAYLRFWAVEMLIGHWDSYSNNGNNFFVYAPPPAGKFRFVPWGADSVLGDVDPFNQHKRPETVRAMCILPRRLYQLPATRERYRQQLRQVLGSAWREADLLAEVDRLEALLRPHLHFSASHFQDGLAQVRQFIRHRRTVLEKELASPAQDWTWPLRKSPCLEKMGKLHAIFSGTWQDRPNLGEILRSPATVSLEVDGKKEEFGNMGVTVGPSPDPRNPGCAVISMIGLQLASGRLQAPVLLVQPESFRANTNLLVDGFSVAGILIEGKLTQGKIGLDGLMSGTLRLQEAGTKPGDRVSGRLEADIYHILR
jgi:hypothetical protein